MFEKEYEEKNVPFQPGYALIKGPLGEVYQVSNIDLAKKYNQQGDVFISKSEETCKFVKITGNLFDIMKKSKQFVEIDDETLQMETSYDQLNTVKKGDYVRIDNDNFYRVKPEAFKLTYEVLPFNNILKINAKNIMA
jgi:hypothetical protein